MEGARLVLARLWLHYPKISTYAVATSVPKNHPLESFFDEVASDYELDVTVE